jgi:hypothetical protein
MAGLPFYFTGPDAEADARDFADFLGHDFAEQDLRTERRVPPSREAATRGGELIAVIALILAIPCALSDTLRFADRIKLTQKFRRVLDWARARHERGQSNPHVLLPPHNRPVPLHEARLEDIFDAIAPDVAQTRNKYP